MCTDRRSDSGVDSKYHFINGNYVLQGPHGSLGPKTGRLMNLRTKSGRNTLTIPPNFSLNRLTPCLYMAHRVLQRFLGGAFLEIP